MLMLIFFQWNYKSPRNKKKSNQLLRYINDDVIAEIDGSRFYVTMKLWVTSLWPQTLRNYSDWNCSVNTVFIFSYALLFVNYVIVLVFLCTFNFKWTTKLKVQIIMAILEEKKNHFLLRFYYRRTCIFSDSTLLCSIWYGVLELKINKDTKKLLVITCLDN